ncbi:MAG TPA: divalent metal cation transporter [Verrucomicrobiae bacterium]|jgi:Mn2+/Fe2+ NRAMP family transporter|nr:divalent metal cation transporter [Verrucomicrobiae bacterium]
MGSIVHVALGILTSIGGFLEIGSIVTAMQAGSEFGFRHLWVVAVGATFAVVLTEMAGRFSAVSRRSLGGALRERFGAAVFAAVLLGLGVTSLLVLGAEVTGLAVATELATGIPFRLWALPAGLIVWLILWKGKFGVIEYGVAGLGLVTLSFLAAAIHLEPPTGELLAGLVPSGPEQSPARYWFIAVSILAATLTPYLFYFYSSGAIEDEWTSREIVPNRIVASVGMLFGGVLSASVLVVAAMVMRGMRVDNYTATPMVLSRVFGRAGFWLFVGSLWIGCLGAALEITLTLAYVLAQGFNWHWGENERPRDATRFVVAYSLFILVGTGFALAGVDALQLTNLAMALTSAVLPLALAPLLLLMNDRRYLGTHCNGWLTNGIMALIVVVAVLLAGVSIPLAVAGKQ